MKFTENRRIAWLILALVVIAGLLLGSSIRLGGARGKALHVFVCGVDDDFISVYSDLQERANCAVDIAATAERYASIDTKLTSEVTRLADRILRAGRNNTTSLYETNLSLSRAVESLYTEIENTALSDADKSFVYGKYKELHSRANTIERDGYNQSAAEYNKLISGFPAGLLAGLTGNGALADFS